MGKVLLAGPYHRITELNSIAERCKNVPNMETVVVTLNDDMSFGDIRNLIRDTMDSETVVVVEVGYEYRAVNDKSSPFIAMHNPGFNKLLVRMPSLQDLIYSRKKKFDFITAVVLSIAEKFHKDIIVLPWRGDDTEEPTYSPPECWLDNVDSDNIYYYE